MAPLRIEMLGGLRVFVSGQLVERFQTRKTAELLAYLAIEPGRTRSREELMELLWPDGDPIAIRNRLNQAVSSLRRQLEPPNIAPRTVLQSSHFDVKLVQESVEIDTREFVDLINLATHEVDQDAKVSMLQQALALYRGDFLEGIQEDWVSNERLRLSDKHLMALADLVVLLRQLRRIEEAIEIADKKVRADPLDEKSHRQLMRLYCEAGRPLSAIRQFNELVRVFDANELEPSRKAIQLRENAEELAQRYGQTESASGHVSRSVTPRDPRPASKPTLPVSPTPFFGRADELAFVENHFEQGGQLLTLIGVGGSGKSRLALEGARLLGGRGFQPQYVLTTSVTDEQELLVELARALTSEDVSIDGILFALAGNEKPLLVVDGAERFDESACAVLEKLCAQSSSLSVLITSRRPLQLAGESLLAVQPLPLPQFEPETTVKDISENPSVQLFVSRARDVRPDFQITERNAATIAELCRRLEGLPLAIELAAAWARTLTPKQMVDQLQERFSLLTSRRRDIPARHRSMRAVIDESYGRLDPQVKKVFAALSIFEGGWTGNAARHVCGGENIEQALSLLEERSLITVQSQDYVTRYRMLDIVRDYAFEMLTGDELSERGFLHAEYFANLVGREGDGDFSGGELLADQQNLNAALLYWLESNQNERGLGMACDLAEFWQMWGRVAEGRDWLRKLRSEDVGEALRARSLGCEATLAWFGGDFEQSRQLYTEALSLYNDLGDLEGAMQARTAQAYEAHRRGEYKQAEALLEINLSMASAMEDLPAQAIAWLMLGNAAVEQLNWDLAGTRYENSLTVARQLGNQDRIGQALNNLGNLAILHGMPKVAKQHLSKALELFNACGAESHSVDALLNMAKLDRLQKSFSKALGWLESIKQPPELLIYLELLFLEYAYVSAGLGEFVIAGQLFGFVERLCEESNDMRFGLEAADFAACRKLLLDQMGDREFESARELGRAISRQDAFELARSLARTRTSF